MTARVVTGHFSGDYVAFRERHGLSACSSALSSVTILRNPFDCSQFGLASGSQCRTVLYLPSCQRTSDGQKRSCPVQDLRTRPHFGRQMAHLCALLTRKRLTESLPRSDSQRRAVRPTVEVSFRLPGIIATHVYAAMHSVRRTCKMLVCQVYLPHGGNPPHSVNPDAGTELSVALADGHPLRFKHRRDSVRVQRDRR